MVRKKPSGRRSRRRVRDKDLTRARLLAAGFEEVYTRGFQSASVDGILARLGRVNGVTKGAFFHHFANKTEFGYALVDEVITSMIRVQWVDTLAVSTDPLTAIADAFESGVQVLEAAPLNLGCPLNNIAQEMSPLDDGFRIRTQQVFELWMRTFELALRRGQAASIVRRSIDPRAAAFSLVAEIEGILSLSRNSQDGRVLRLGLRESATPSRGDAPQTRLVSYFLVPAFRFAGRLERLADFFFDPFRAAALFLFAGAAFFLAVFAGLRRPLDFRALDDFARAPPDGLPAGIPVAGLG